MQEICEEEFNLDPQKWQKLALDEPVVITDKGQPKLYLLSKPVFDSLYKGSRRHLHVSELSEEAKKAFLEAEVPAEYENLNSLMDEEKK